MSDKTVGDLHEQLWRRKEDQTITTVDLNTYDRKIREWVKDMMNGMITQLETIINTEIERVCKEQDERCIIELCKIIDEKLEEFREELYEDDE
jgi:uncharacterized protein YaaR (DUF327 family)